MIWVYPGVYQVVKSFTHGDEKVEAVSFATKLSRINWIKAGCVSHSVINYCHLAGWFLYLTEPYLGKGPHICIYPFPAGNYLTLEAKWRTTKCDNKTHCQYPKGTHSAQCSLPFVHWTCDLGSCVKSTFAVPLNSEWVWSSKRKWAYIRKARYCHISCPLEPAGFLPASQPQGHLTGEHRVVCATV